MPTSRPGPGRGPALAAWTWAALASGPAAAAQAPVAGPTGTELWPLAFLVLAVAAVGAAAAAGLAFGRQRAAAAQAEALRAAHAALRQTEALLPGWTWQTDAAHRLQSVRAPADALPSAPTLPPEVTDSPALRYALKAQRSFAGLRVALPGGGWRLCGQPHFDEGGRFAGFAGFAEPTADQEEAGASALALRAVLQARGAPMLLAEHAGPHGADWTLRAANPAARALCTAATSPPTPALAGDAAGQGVSLGPLLTALAAPAPALPLAEALLELSRPATPPGPLQAAGWQLQRYGPLPDGKLGALLWRETTAPAAEVSETSAAEADQFSFTLSHDLRAPIRVVEGFTRIVKEDYGPQLDRVGNDHLDRVLGAAARMNQMIDALLTLARLSQQPLARQPVNLSQLAGYIVDELRRGVPEREAEVQIEPGLATIGDPTLLRLVLENLLGNAWKYTGRCARAQIGFGRERVDGRWAFVVRDNGAGFDMRSADRLFGLFQRLHSANDFPGTGVGLASVQRIVRRHRGEIWAQAEPGRGAAFHFTLGE